MGVSVEKGPNSSPYMALLGDIGQDTTLQTWLLASSKELSGSCRVQTGLELEGVMGSAPVGSSSSPSPRLFQKHRARSKRPSTEDREAGLERM